MDSIIRIGLGSILFFMFLFYSVDMALIRVIDDDNRDALDIASRTAISESVNRGTLRVEERITIDPSVAKEALVRTYAKNISMNDSSSGRLLNIKSIQEEPAMIAVEAKSKTNSFYKHYLNNRWSEEFKNSKTIVANERNIVIYEAKSLTIPPKGGVTN